MQLVAYGAQDIYLTGNPQITFFKVVYRRHTNFSMESIQQNFTGNAVAGQQVTATITRNGDLIHKMYVSYNPQGGGTNATTGLAIAAGANGGAAQTGIGANVGNTLLSQVELEIGGQMIDKHYSQWLTIWDELTTYNPYGISSRIGTLGAENGERQGNANNTGIGAAPANRAENTNAVQPNGFTGRISASRGGQAGAAPGQSPDRSFTTLKQRMSYNHRGTHRSIFGVDLGGAEAKDTQNAPSHAFIPLKFWFCRHPGLALPLIALQYHEVKVKITFSNTQDIFINPGGGAENLRFAQMNPQLWVDYIYLDTDERRRFAQQSHEYLIEQVQRTQSDANANIELNFNHPVKELIWTGAPLARPTSETESAGSPNSFRRTVAGLSIANSSSDRIKLVLNGHDRFAERHPHYFTRTQVYQHHTGWGGITKDDSIGVYSFALKPEEHQPSGTCNFSRIDNASLERTTTGGLNAPLNVYAVNYNVLRIMSGMGGLAYSN